MIFGKLVDIEPSNLRFEQPSASHEVAAENVISSALSIFLLQFVEGSDKARLRGEELHPLLNAHRSVNRFSRC
jgi:hypothetical protein